MIRIGHGYDLHRLVDGRPLIIGGVDIEFNKGLLGHSDADVLLHAICDALLGAAALGDIGSHFPDTDPKYKGINSTELLKNVVTIIYSHGYKICNIDSTIIAEQPKMRPYIDQMCQNIANALNVDIDFISVKAKTEEGLGYLGDSSAIAAHAVCVIEK